MPVNSKIDSANWVEYNFFPHLCAINYNTKVINFESKKVDIAQHSAIRLYGGNFRRKWSRHKAHVGVVMLKIQVVIVFTLARTSLSQMPGATTYVCMSSMPT